MGVVKLFVGILLWSVNGLKVKIIGLLGYWVIGLLGYWVISIIIVASTLDQFIPYNTPLNSLL